MLKLAIIFLVVAAALLFFPGNGNGSQSYIGFLLDSAHLPLFGAVAIAIGILVSSRSKLGPKQLAITAILSTVIAAAVEIVQPLVGRSTSFNDFINGLCGSVLGAAFFYICKQEAKQLGLNITFTFSLLACCALALLSPYKQWQLEQWQKTHFPVVADFENPKEELLWKTYRFKDNDQAVEEPQLARLTNRYVSSGKNALSLELPKARWSGWVLNLHGANWSNYQLLKFNVFNPGKEFRLRLRIDDKNNSSSYNKRVNRSFMIKPGANNIELAISELKKIDIKKIDRLLLFLGKNSLPKQFIIDNFRLE